MIKYRKVLSEYNFLRLSFLFWAIYFFYVLGLTFYQFSELKKVKWETAYLHGHGISNIKGSVNNYTFINTQNEAEITRSYFSIAGLNKSFWGIDKSNTTFPISFYLRKNDFDKIKINDIEFSKNIFGKNTSTKERIPFFALRTTDREPSKFSLLTDLWKYNFSIFSVLFLVIPQAASLINSKYEIFKPDPIHTHQKKLTSTMTIIILLVMGLNLVA